MALNKLVETITRAYYEILDEEIKKFCDWKGIEFDKEDFARKSDPNKLAANDRIYYKGKLVIEIEQNLKMDGTFEFVGDRHYLEVENGERDPD